MERSTSPAIAKVSRLRKPDGMTVEEWQFLLRRQYGQQQKFKIKNVGGHPILSDFEVLNPETRRAYKVAIRSAEPGMNFCSCPDFRVNTLGTCKHVEFTLAKLGKMRGARRVFRDGVNLPYSSVTLKYGARRSIRLRIGSDASAELKTLAKEYFDDEGVLRPGADERFDRFLQQVSDLKHEVRCYDDALDFIARLRDDRRRRELIDRKYGTVGGDRLLRSLLKTDLYPYQKEGILFAAKAGRCLLGDDMGLGKTVQAIGATEILARDFGVERVLIVCPTSLKYQWKSEIEKFCGRTAEVMEGHSHRREATYRAPGFFKIASYHAAFRDLDVIRQNPPDLVILDEAQRIKNWQTRTAQSIKQIPSTYAIVLTGTPLENKLEELHSIVEFVDRHRLGPLFRFLNNHQIFDEKNKVVGYGNLNEIGKTLAPILIRRRKQEVLKQLPARSDKNYFVPMTPEQWEIHEENRETVARLAAKWRRFGFLSEAEQRILLVSLNCMRMACDSTYILDEKTRFGTKIGELGTFLDDLFASNGAKAVIFSQWERMTRLAAEHLEQRKVKYEYLHGGVPARKRKDLMDRFRDDEKCRIFLSTDAGGVGINLQSASVVVNLDLPWNPAVLEQRIGRVHRLGQHRPVRVVNFVSEGTIEHGLLDVLKFKKSIFAGVLDEGKNEVLMGESRFKRFMKTVEGVTAAVPRTARDDPREEMEEIVPPSERKKGVKPASSDSSPWQELITVGASFLEKLGSAMKENGKGGFSRLLETDASTGQRYLKIPVQDEKVLGAAVKAIGSFMDVFRSGLLPSP